MYLIRLWLVPFIFLLVIPCFGVYFTGWNQLFYVVGTYAFGCGVIIFYIKKEYYLPKNERC